MIPVTAPSPPLRGIRVLDLCRLLPGPYATWLLGSMGAEVIKAVVGAEGCSLVGAIDNTPGKEGADVGLELGLTLGT